jgi:hypothetical protein
VFITAHHYNLPWACWLQWKVYFFEIHFISISVLPSTPRSPKWSLSFRSWSLKCTRLLLRIIIIIIGTVCLNKCRPNPPVWHVLHVCSCSSEVQNKDAVAACRPSLLKPLTPRAVSHIARISILLSVTYFGESSRKPSGGMLAPWCCELVWRHGQGGVWTGSVACSRIDEGKRVRASGRDACPSWRRVISLYSTEPLPRNHYQFQHFCLSGQAHLYGASHGQPAPLWAKEPWIHVTSVVDFTQRVCLSLVPIICAKGWVTWPTLCACSGLGSGSKTFTAYLLDPTYLLRINCLWGRGWVWMVSR